MPHQFRITGAMSLAEGVAAGGKRHGLVVVHRHPPESLADVSRRPERVGVPVGTFRVHIDKAHLHRGEWVLQLAVAGVTLVSQPYALGAPIDIFLRLPYVG